MARSELEQSRFAPPSERPLTHIYLVTRFGGRYRDAVTDILDAHGVLPNGKGPEYFDVLDRHEKSQAHYLTDYYKEKDRVLVSFIDRHSITSRHYHPEPIIETYIPIAGKLYVTLEDQEQELTPEGLVIPATKVHQAKTKDSHALTLIIMKGAKEIPAHLQHVRQ